MKEAKQEKVKSSAPNRAKKNLRTVKLFADVEDSNGKVHKVLQRDLPFLVPDGRKHMLRLRRERQLARGKVTNAT